MRGCLQRVIAGGAKLNEKDPKWKKGARQRERDRERVMHERYST